MSLAFRCEVCDTDPRWTMVRIGDVVTTWACAEHVDEVMERLQRVHEVTELKVTFTPKSHEWAEIQRMLNAVANEDGPR